MLTCRMGGATLTPLRVKVQSSGRKRKMDHRREKRTSNNEILSCGNGMVRIQSADGRSRLIPVFFFLLTRQRGGSRYRLKETSKAASTMRLGFNVQKPSSQMLGYGVESLAYPSRKVYPRFQNNRLRKPDFAVKE